MTTKVLQLHELYEGDTAELTQATVRDLIARGAMVKLSERYLNDWFDAVYTRLNVPSRERIYLDFASGGWVVSSDSMESALLHEVLIIIMAHIIKLEKNAKE